jgi:hypothetical protein
MVHLFKIIIKSPLNFKILSKIYAYLESLKKVKGDLCLKALTTPFILELHDFPKMEDMELELTKD